MCEIMWKPVEGFEDKYLVSNTGLVKGLISGKILKPFGDGHGYLKVNLSIAKKKSKHVHVHRLVAMAFCDNYFKGAHVNHKDCCRMNNNFSNLEWVTRRYNDFYRAMTMHHTSKKIRYKTPKKCLTMLRNCAIIYAAGWSQEVTRYWRHLDAQGD